MSIDHLVFMRCVFISVTDFRYFTLQVLNTFHLKQSAIHMNATQSAFNDVQDAVFPNDSLISTNWTDDVPGCSIWKKPNHVLFQVANGILLLGLLSPECWKHGVLFLHSTFAIGRCLNVEHFSALNCLKLALINIQKTTHIFK